MIRIPDTLPESRCSEIRTRTPRSRHMIRSRLCLSALVLCASACCSADDLQARIDAAIAAGGGTVSIAAGEVRLAKGLTFSNARDVVLQGAGAGQTRLVITDPEQVAVSLSYSSRITLRGFTIDYDPIPSTQGAITAIDRSGAQTVIDVRVDAGYRTDTAWLAKDASDGELYLVPFDAATLLIKKRTPQVSVSAVSAPTPGTLRITLAADASLAVGDLVATRAWRATALDCYHATDTVIADLTIHAAYGGGIFEYGGGGGTRASFRMVRGPKPPGATRERLLSVNRDGFHSTEVERGAVLEDCVIEHVGDDALASHATLFKVTNLDAAARRLTLSDNNWPAGEVGDRLTIWDPPGMTPNTSRPVIQAVDPANPRNITLDSVAGIANGDYISFPGRSGSGFTARRVRIHDGCATGMFLMSPNILIEDCEVSHTALTGIELSMEAGPYYYTGPVPSGSIVRRTTVIGTCFSDLQRGPHHQAAAAVACLIKAGIGTDQPDPYLPIHPNREITDLLFEDLLIEDTGAWGLIIANARRVTVADCRFRRTNTLPPDWSGWPWDVSPDGAVLVVDSSEVRFTRRNTVLDDRSPGGHPLQVGANVDGLDSSGITGVVGSDDLPPEIAAIADLAVQVGVLSEARVVTIDDRETAPGSLTVTARSLDQAVLRDADIQVGGTGAARTLRVLATTAGATTVQVTVTDGVSSTTTAMSLTASAGPPPSSGPGAPTGASAGGGGGGGRCGLGAGLALLALGLCFAARTTSACRNRSAG